jgi:hypothetical protein
LSLQFFLYVSHSCKLIVGGGGSGRGGGGPVQLKQTDGLYDYGRSCGEGGREGGERGGG